MMSITKNQETKSLVRGDSRVSGGGRLWRGQNFSEVGFVKTLVNGGFSPVHRRQERFSDRNIHSADCLILALNKK